MRSGRQRRGFEEHLGIVNALIDASVTRSMAAWKESIADLI